MAVSWVTAHIDGGARGNPGPAGFGVHITAADGKTLAELSEYIGHKTNNVAEYTALLAALDYAIQHKLSALQVVGDSELLVKQIKGQYKVKSPDLLPLYERARSMIRKLDRFEVRHVLRAKNKDADRLANLAMDRGMGKTLDATTSHPLPREYNGIVLGGVVELLSGELPEGTLVKVRPAK